MNTRKDLVTQVDRMVHITWKASSKIALREVTLVLTFKAQLAVGYMSLATFVHIVYLPVCLAAVSTSKV